MPLKKYAVRLREGPLAAFLGPSPLFSSQPPLLDGGMPTRPIAVSRCVRLRLSETGKSSEVRRLCYPWSHQFAGILDKQLGNGIERPIFERDDTDGTGLHW